MTDAAGGPTAEALERGRKLFAGRIDFVRGVASIDALPHMDRPEIAFAGRSNVGKSSLINALTGRRALARASAEPGRTRELNFFDLGGEAFLVDLPGYGYAKAPKTHIDRWTKLMKAYLRGRASLRRIMLLIDARRGIGQADLDMMKAFDEAAVVYHVVLTKADKIRDREREALLKKTAETLMKRPAAFPRQALVSAHDGEGLEALRGEIAEALFV